ncbi:MAG: T9SS type A sorting domain-containing protein, partial [Fidelibacterota bacterium]
YITHQLARTLDFRDDQTTQGVGATHEWVYQNNGSHVVVEWPFHLDVSYATTSAAYTHSLDGLPVGNLNAFPDKLAEWQTLSTDSEKSDLAPASFSLSQNYPNPFNPSTEIAYTLDKSTNISLTIFNVIGQKVKVLENSSKQAGTHTAKWDGRDEFGASVSTGLYFYTISDGVSSFTRKMALMK